MIGAIPSRPTGSSPRAIFYQWVWDNITRTSRVAFSRGAKISQTVQGTFVEPLDTGDGADSRVRQYVLTDASKGDYFVCRTLALAAGETEGGPPALAIGSSDVYIAKPPHLRQSLFDRDVLNAADPGNIGTADEITYDVTVESWDGVTFSSATKKFSFEYKSATFRIATDETDEDPDNWTTQKQTVIPHLVPAVLDEPDDGPVTTATITPTIIHAIRCGGLGVTRPTDPDEPDGDQTAISLLALSDGWAWSKTL
jgi:hypothetical protein